MTTEDSTDTSAQAALQCGAAENSDAAVFTAAGYDRVERFAKQRIALRYWLSGAQYYLALEAFEFAAAYHRGSRKDGRTPEFAHQVSIAAHVRTLVPHLRFPEETVCAALLHDVREDYDVPDAAILERFGPRVAAATDALTKEFMGVRRDPATVFAAIAADPCASVVKPADRVNNQLTALGVFSAEKIASYVAETRQWFLPMMRDARRLHPSQEAAYENLKLVLEAQVESLSAVAELGAPT